MTSSYFCRIADLPHLLPIYRSSRSQMLFVIGVLKSFTIFLGKYMCWNLFLTKYFLVNIVKFLRSYFFIEHLQWLLLDLFLACGSSRLEVFCGKGVLTNFAKFTGKHKKEKKETLSQVFSSEFCKIFKNSFSYRIPPVAASVYVIPHSLPILSHPLATSNRVLPPSFSN